MYGGHPNSLMCTLIKVLLLMVVKPKIKVITQTNKRLYASQSFTLTLCVTNDPLCCFTSAQNIQTTRGSGMTC